MILEAKELGKKFVVPKKKGDNFTQKIKNIFYRENIEKIALKNVSFTINEGEFIGYIGPNGAGKSTTIKILTGIITPTSGTVNVLGFNPHEERYEYTKNIGVVFGQRRLLQYDVPVMDSFRLYKAIYEINDKDFKERLNYFDKALKLDKYLHIPVRKLSLGERMRCEIAASLLHKPKILFLDEPTIGLDQIAKEEIRNFLRTINEKFKTTILLTTHDMDDIEALCKRVIIIDKGKLIYDGDLESLKKKIMTEKTIEIRFEKIKNAAELGKILQNKNIKVLRKDPCCLKIAVSIKKISLTKLVDKLFDIIDVIDLNIQEPQLDEVIKEIYTHGV